MIEVVCSLRFEALHHWPDARELLPRVGFLADRHRHVFHVRCWKRVDHGDRHTEFIALKRDVGRWLRLKFRQEQDVADLGARSCEMLAQELIDAFNLSRCEVLEDGENGAVVTP